MHSSLLDQLAHIVGEQHCITNPEILATRSVDYTGQYHGHARALLRPATTHQISEILRLCRDTATPVTIQGGRTSLVAGTVPYHYDILLSTERLTTLTTPIISTRTIHAGAGVTLADLQHILTHSGLFFGVDLSSRASATLGGMAATNAGGLYSIGYGTMMNQIRGLEIVLPNGDILYRHDSSTHSNGGYNLTGLFVGSEGTLGVITSLDLQLYPIPTGYLTLLCGFSHLNHLLQASTHLENLTGIRALELIDPSTTTLLHQAMCRIPVEGPWLLLAEITTDHDLIPPTFHQLTTTIPPHQCAIATDTLARRQLWTIREKIADLTAHHGPIVKLDISIPRNKLNECLQQIHRLIHTTTPNSQLICFGHLGQDNFHLNILHCPAQYHAILQEKILTLITNHHGTISAEHGIGTTKPPYLSLCHSPHDLHLMHNIKNTLDPTHYLNSAVLFTPSPYTPRNNPDELMRNSPDPLSPT